MTTSLWMLSSPRPGKLHKTRCKVACSCQIQCQWLVGPWKAYRIQVLLAGARMLDLQHGNTTWSCRTCCMSLCQPLRHYQRAYQKTNTNRGAVARWSPLLYWLRWRPASQPESCCTICHQALLLVGSSSIWHSCWCEPPAGSANAQETVARSTAVAWLGQC